VPEHDWSHVGVQPPHVPHTEAFVPVDPRVVPQLLVCVNPVPLQTVDGRGDHEETVQQEPL
jgi:hypothetical protein